MQVKDITWKHVAIILGFFATVAGLSVVGGDTAAFIVVGMAILAGVGVVAVKTTETKEQTVAVKEQTNGNMSKLLELVQEQTKMLAAMQPPPADDKQDYR